MVYVVVGGIERHRKKYMQPFPNIDVTSERCGVNTGQTLASARGSTRLRLLRRRLLSFTFCGCLGRLAIR